MNHDIYRNEDVIHSQYTNWEIIYRKSSIKPPGGLSNFGHSRVAY